MDKKNTILLTVIAVATLLVAVVGATFAYFSIGASGSSNTNIRVGAQNVSAITLGIGGEHPHLTLNASDMTKDKAGDGGKTYYSTTESSKGYEETNTDHNFAKVTLNGGDKDVKYTCTATLKVTLKNDNAAEFEEGEGKLHLSGDTDVDLTQLNWLKSGVIDFSELTSEKTGTVKFTLTGTGSEPVNKYIKGYLEFTNTNDDQTSRLNGFEVTTQIDVDNFSCDLTPGA